MSDQQMSDRLSGDDFVSFQDVDGLPQKIRLRTIERLFCHKYGCVVCCTYDDRMVVSEETYRYIGEQIDRLAGQPPAGPQGGAE